ncbi:MAG: 30S ribosomal protein S13 [Anaerolineales bacterium]|jgi:small subunit ribosomal protein S13|nr:30S ribosomal protein S13 [Anaerolineales bacterium]NTW12310.1 30S ribosomal protein S13 [Anaerolineales bacterium]
MARIEGVDLPRNKRVEVGLTYLYGIGPTRAREILVQTRVNPDVRVKDLSESDVAAIREYIGKHFTVEGDLRREVQMSIKRLIEIGSYRGLRHRRNLPVRGQRTKTNSRTRKGVKKTVAGRGRRRGAKK